MNSQSGVKVLFLVIFYLIFQVLILKSLVLFGVAFCFAYLAAVLFLPSELPVTWVLIIAFFLGLTVDVFYNTGGIHAATTVLIGFTRKSILRAILGNKFSESESDLNYFKIGTYNLIQYVLVSVLIHQSTLFFLEAASIINIGTTLLKIGSSTILTVFVILITQIIIEGSQD